MPEIYVDADACPVKDEIRRVAERCGQAITKVADGQYSPELDLSKQ